MARARAGDPGARRRASAANVFTRILLALFGEVPWRAVPVMPVEIMLLPRWFPFHLAKVSYWSRTVIVPLLVLMALRPRARNPRGVTIRELFVDAAGRRCATGSAARPRRAVGQLFGGSTGCCAWPSRCSRRRAGGARSTRRCAFVTERLNGEDGLGGIYPGDGQRA